MARLLVAWCYVRVFFPPEGERYLVTLSDGLLLEDGCNVLSAYQSLELECLDRYRHILLRRLLAPTDWHALFVFAPLLLGGQLLRIAGLQWATRYRAIMEAWHFLQAAEEVVRAGVF